MAAMDTVMTPRHPRLSWKAKGWSNLYNDNEILSPIGVPSADDRNANRRHYEGWK